MKPQGRGARTSQNQKNPKPWTNKAYHLPDYHLGHHPSPQPPTPAELWEARGALSLPEGSPQLWERSSAQGPEPLPSWCQHSQWREHQGPQNLADAPARTQTTWLLTGQRICRTFCAYHPGAKMSFPFQARTLQPSPYPLPVPQTKPNKNNWGEKKERMFHGSHRGRNHKRQPDWGMGGLIKCWATPAGMPCWAILPGLGSLTGPRVTLRIALQPCCYSWATPGWASFSPPRKVWKLICALETLPIAISEISLMLEETIIKWPAYLSLLVKHHTGHTLMSSVLNRTSCSGY